jgi:hypothetical protein
MNEFNPQTPVPGGAPAAGIPVRSIVTCILLSIVTCGIYLYVWLFNLNEDMRRVTGDTNGPSGGVVILLSLVTCGIYMIYWMYKQGDAIDRIKAARGLPNGNTGILYLVLSIFGLSIVSMALLQDELNKMAR